MSAAGDHLDTWEVERLEAIECAARELVTVAGEEKVQASPSLWAQIFKLRSALERRGPGSPAPGGGSPADAGK